MDTRYPLAPATSFQSKATESIVDEQLITGAIKFDTVTIPELYEVSHPGSATVNVITLAPGTAQVISYGPIPLPVMVVGLEKSQVITACGLALPVKVTMVEESAHTSSS
jgi:hypothetical protein